MHLLCVAPASWWSLTTDEPAPGPAYGEVCNAVCEVDGGYVLEGYGEEPFDGRWFIPLSETVVREEMELIEV